MRSREATVLERTPAGSGDDPKAGNDRVLAQVLERESALADQLGEALARQRAAVASNAPESVHGSCDDIGRILGALEEARRRRAGLLAAMCGAEPATLESLAAQRGGALPPALERARARLRASAEAVTREASTNRELLRRCMANGEAYLQALFSAAAAPDPTYRAGERRDDGAQGFLFDRKG